jgi:predicted MPP superfamily phosphohydrolase
MAGRCLPEIAFKNYDKQYPGIILAHNPDSSALLESYPGEVILSGHTHGCQINLPWMWKKFTKLENMSLRKGFFKVRDKWLYVNRGVGAIMKFRWFSVPEILFLTLRKKS